MKDMILVVDIAFIFDNTWKESFSFYTRRVWRYQRGNQNL